MHTFTFPDASTADLGKIVEDLEASGIELASQAPADLHLPGWHDIRVALGAPVWLRLSTTSCGRG